jgi:hypothetical protein
VSDDQCRVLLRRRLRLWGFDFDLLSQSLAAGAPTVSDG